ncbi:MAG: hypothetical protein V1738_06450 [Patescibacteria group bacterium]
MNKLRKLIVIPFLALLLFPVLMPISASAESTDTYTNSLKEVGEAAYGEVDSDPDQLPQMIGRIINVALGLLGMVLLVLIIYGGFLWMTAQGNSDQVDKAKQIMTNAVIGLVIIMASYAIANFVFDAILRSTVAPS